MFNNFLLLTENVVGICPEYGPPQSLGLNLLPLPITVVMPGCLGTVTAGWLGHCLDISTIITSDIENTCQSISLFIHNIIEAKLITA